MKSESKTIKVIRELFVNPLALLVLVLVWSCSSKPSFYSASDFGKVPKIDAHFHYLTTDVRYMEFASSLNFRLLSPIWDGEEVSIKDQMKFSTSILHLFPSSYAFFGTFPVDSFNYPNFSQKTIANIQKFMLKGASGVKIWKNIGMVLKDSSGKYVTIDNPKFEPIFKYLEENNISIIAHLGEPKNCWLPLEEMNNPSDVWYYKANPQYHMFLNPEVPNYERQIEARDYILKNYPKLDFVGAHLGSLEWSVDELAKRFEAYPNLKVDLAGRMFHVQYQSNKDYEKVRNFMIKYQDRIEYGTDTEVHDNPDLGLDQMCNRLKKGWFRDWLYLATDSIVDNSKGLKLPASVVDKIYYRNAESYFGKNE